MIDRRWGNRTPDGKPLTPRGPWTLIRDGDGAVWVRIFDACGACASDPAVKVITIVNTVLVTMRCGVWIVL